MMDRRGPSHALTDRAIDFAEPLSSISLPNTAPSKNSGKNEMMNSPVLVMKIWV